VNTALNF